MRRTWLLGRLSGHLDRVRDRIDELLALGDEALIDAVGGSGSAAIAHQRDRVDPAAERARCATFDIAMVCRCDDGYPGALHELAAPPAVLHTIGGLDRLTELARARPVAVVGARRCSPYGEAVADALARSVAGAGVPVLSGMALGIDATAHRGVLAVDGLTVAVLATGPECAYPARARELHRRITERGVLVSELAPGTKARRWTFPARNRIIAALSAMTVVVQARSRSGALVTARHAADLGRIVGAVPGEITSPLSAGPHRLLREGAELVDSAQDVLDALFGPGARTVPGAPGLAAARRAQLSPEVRRLLDAIADGHPAADAFRLTGLGAEDGLAALASLELGGWVRRQPGGRFSVAP